MWLRKWLTECFFDSLVMTLGYQFGIRVQLQYHLVCWIVGWRCISSSRDIIMVCMGLFWIMNSLECCMWYMICLMIKELPQRGNETHLAIIASCDWREKEEGERFCPFLLYYWVGLRRSPLADKIISYYLQIS